MAVKASPETIREMKRNISNTIRNIEQINSIIKGGMSKTGNWNDAKAQQFQSVMQQVARLTEAPLNTLQGALPKLEKLAESLDGYNHVKF